jgi:RNA polymerase sigma-70 factor (ECF subfamily)
VAVSPPEPTRLGEVTWLEPYPDMLLSGIPDRAPGPEARYESSEAISLAFVSAVQLLPPRQRAVLLLRDVLGFPASEAAEILGVTQESVTSALKRARATLRTGAAGAVPPGKGSAAEELLVRRLTAAYEAGDVAAIVALFGDDAWLRMPPAPLEYQGRELIGRFLRDVAFRDGRTFLLVPARGERAARVRDLPAGHGRAERLPRPHAGRRPDRGDDTFHARRTSSRRERRG